MRLVPFRPAAPRRGAGFTLIELMIVIVIVAGVASAGAAALGRRGHAQAAANLARGVQFAVLEARTGAVSDGFQRRLRCTALQCALEVATTTGMAAPAAWRSGGDIVQAGSRGRVWAVTSTTDLAPTAPPAGPLPGVATITLFPDGSATASTIYLSDLNGASRYKIYIYPATGLARLAEGW